MLDHGHGCNQASSQIWTNLPIHRHSLLTMPECRHNRGNQKGVGPAAQSFEKFNRHPASQHFRLKQRRTLTCDWMNGDAADAFLIDDHFRKKIVRPGRMISLGENEITQRKKNGLPTIDLDSMRYMWMMA